MVGGLKRRRLCDEIEVGYLLPVAQAEWCFLIKLRQFLALWDENRDE